VDTYPLPAAVESFVKRSGGRIFRKLDLKLAYLQLKVDEHTAKLLKLNTPLGLMKMNRQAFGVNAAPGIFQRVMANALSGKDMKQHNMLLHTVLDRLNNLGFHPNIKKCVLATDSIQFLGYMIDAKGLHPLPAKVKEIKENQHQLIKRRRDG
jgi:hypothetical protein